jgi:Carboxypeptidase regulatory-like domain
MMWRSGRTGLLFAIWSPAFLLAQANLSTLRGTAQDPGGAMVGDASVSLVNVATNLKRSALTNSSGDYEIPQLKPGTYRLIAGHPGFKNYVAENVILEGAQIRRVDIIFELGSVDSKVTVSANAAVIETDTAKIESGVKQKRYEDSPLGRNFGEPRWLLATMPNVFTNPGTSVFFAGQQNAQIQEGMDGVKTDGATNQIHKMDEVEQMEVVTVNNSAEVSRIGYYNQVSKSGTNQFHGGGYYYLENSALDARAFFAPTKTKGIFHTIGANVSGPIFKNRTFFYGSWYEQRVPSSSFYLQNVPTAAMRTGDFSQLLGLKSPTIVKGL